MRKKLLAALVVSLSLIAAAVALYLSNYPEVSGGILIFCAVCALAGSFGLLWFGPKLQLTSMPDVTGAKDRFEVENEARKSLAGLLAASFFLFSGYIAFSNFESSLDKDRTAQLTKALEMLENDKPAIRLAGANSLALLTRQFNSKGDYKQAIRAMNDVVQQHITLLGTKSAPDNSCGLYPAPPQEIQRLLRFLGNRRYPSTSSNDRLSLDDVDLRGAYMGNRSPNQPAGMWARITRRAAPDTYLGEWAYASFYGSDLSAVNLAYADLENAQFTPSIYTGKAAKLSAACVQYSADQKSYPAPATLAHANIQKANFFQAQMQGAVLLCTDARKTNFPEANLTEANLMCANLQDANLNGTDLSGIDMSKTLCVTPPQLASAKQQPDKKPDFQNCPANWIPGKCDISTPNCLPKNSE